MNHFAVVEPLSVGAFIGALQNAHTGGWAVDVGSNMGFYSVVAAHLAPELRLLSVDMQPKCEELTRCGLELNHLLPSPKITVLNRYVSNKGSAIINVPRAACDTMASPSAVGGRRPGGRLRGTQLRLNQTKLVPVAPINIGRYLLQRSRPGERVAVVKIDTEGFEVRVLQSLRPAWDLLDDIILELQPDAWVLNNISVDEGIATFRELITANRYRVMSLPQFRPGMGQAKFQIESRHVDPCQLPTRNFTPGSRWGLGRQIPIAGLTSAVVFDLRGLEAIIRRGVARKEPWFLEFMLTHKQC